MGLDKDRGEGALIITVGITVLTGMLLSAGLAQPFNDTQPYSKNLKVDFVLSQLLDAGNPQDFALAHNLYMRDRNVRVVVELINVSASLPDYAVEETRYKNKAQVLVPIEKITALSMENNVTFIRAPSKAYPDAPAGTDVSSATATQTPVLKSGFNTTIPLIVSMILIFFMRKKRSDKNVKE